MAKIPVDPNQTPGSEFQRRPGVAPFGPSGWRGVNTEDDPSSLDPNELQRGDNVRFRGKHLYTRPGLGFKVNLNPGYPVQHLREAGSDNPSVRIWATTFGCFGIGPGTGNEIFHYDQNDIPSVQPYAIYPATVSRQAPVAQYGSRLFIGDGSALREVAQTSSPPGSTFGNFSPSPPSNSVAVFTGYKIRALLEFDSKLFVSLEDAVTIGASKIVVWNGLSYQDDLTGIRPALNFGIWRDKIVAGFDSTAANVRYRSSGGAGATWTAVALAGFRCATQGNAFQERGPYLYIAGGNDTIYRFDGTALTAIRVIAGCDAGTGNGVTALTLHNGLLYYAWNTPTPNFLTRLGRHDPDSTAANEWVDTYLDVTAQQAGFTIATSLVAFRRQIYIGGNRTWILATAINNVQGTLSIINSQSAGGAGFGVLQMVKFPAAA
jgi:hypothetical protein